MQASDGGGGGGSTAATPRGRVQLAIVLPTGEALSEDPASIENLIVAMEVLVSTIYQCCDWRLLLVVVCGV